MVLKYIQKNSKVIFISYKTTKKLLSIFYFSIKTRIVSFIHQNNKYYTDSNPLKLIYVNPKQISLSQSVFNNIQRQTPEKISLDNKGRIDKINNTGRVIDGDWDLYVDDLDKSRVFRLLNDRFNHKKSWQECDVFKECMFLISTGKDIYWREISTKEDLFKRVLKLEKLFKNISENGYLPQHKMISKRIPSFLVKIFTLEKVTNEVTANIDRKGNFIHNNSGKHRLAIAKLLNINSIPVRVLIRHKKWQEIRNEFKQYKNSKNKLPEHLNTYITHPDIKDTKLSY